MSRESDAEGDGERTPQRIAVTGTPGTGKTTATDGLTEAGLEVIHLGDVIESEGFYRSVDAQRDSVVADLEALADWLAGRDGILVDSHLAHHFAVDRVIVLRCHPAALERRLSGRGASEAKIRENAESEALDVILAEAVDRHGRDSVYEIDTTDREPAAVTAEIEAVCRGERHPTAGTVNFMEYVT